MAGRAKHRHMEFVARQIPNDSRKHLADRVTVKALGNEAHSKSSTERPRRRLPAVIRDVAQRRRRAEVEPGQLRLQLAVVVAVISCKEIRRSRLMERLVDL